MKKRVTIFAPSPSTFVLRDRQLLSEDFDTVLCLYPSKYGFEIITRLGRLAWSVFRSDLVITWFADIAFYSGILGKIFGTKTVIIVGGFDVAKIESIGYGALLKPRTKRRIFWALRNASAVSAVDGGLVDDMRTQFGEDFGAVVIPTGYDPEFYRPSGTKERIVLSVCSVNNHRGLVKGIDIFAECARMMPDIKFVLVGTRGDAVKLLGEVPINLEVIGSLPPQDLLGYYQKAKVYCQLSMREGLPNAVCEAMLCDCVAVGSDVQGIRTAIGEHGFLVPYGDVSRTCDAIRKAMESDGMGGRDHIIASFPDSKRRDGLTELINELLKR